MSAKMLTIAEAMNNHDQFTPKVPSQQELECVYDTSFHDIQPFLFKVSAAFYHNAVSSPYCHRLKNEINCQMCYNLN